MKKIKFILAFHNHQPVGNFDFVLEDAFNNAYQPFLDVLEQFPQIRMTLHYTGILWEWLTAKHPQFITRLQVLHQKGQIELMGGGFYEPILPSIPQADRQGQLELTNDFLRETFSCKPKGIWVAERVWEPSLPYTLTKAGIEYVVVDDSHFKAIGLETREMLGMFITEEEGIPLRVFPISEKLRYLIPFQQPQKTLEYFESIADEEQDTLIVMADDGEKLGNWPGTHQWVYHEKWLERFFTMLVENSELIETLTFSEYISQYPPKGRAYLPTASYMEMQEWALPTRSILKHSRFKDYLHQNGVWERYGDLVGGGFWRNFLVKYPESNDMHKKMCCLSERIHNSDKLSGNELKQALKELWQGQCNCAYWHGAFGGLYLKHLRGSIYQHLIAAENILDNATHGAKPWQQAQIRDLNLDGHLEVLLSNQDQNLYLSPAQGGMIYGWDIKSKNFNLLDTLARREEPYHQKLLELNKDDAGQGEDSVPSIHDQMKVKEEGLENLLFYDWHRRASLLDHFLGSGSDFTSFSQSRHHEEGDFVNQPYEYRLEKSAEQSSLVMFRKGRLWRSEGAFPFKVQKKITWSSSKTFEVLYELTNLSQANLDVWWGVEFNLSFIGGDRQEKYVRADHENTAYDQSGSFASVSDFTAHDLKDNWQLVVEYDQQSELWIFPIATISNSESGVEKNYQSTVVFPSFRLNLEAEDTWSLALKIELKTK